MNSLKGKLQLVAGIITTLWVFVAMFCSEPGYLYSSKCDCEAAFTFFGIVGGFSMIFAIIYGIRQLLYEGAKNCKLRISYDNNSKTEE